VKETAVVLSVNRTLTKSFKRRRCVKQKIQPLREGDGASGSRALLYSAAPANPSFARLPAVAGQPRCAFRQQARHRCPVVTVSIQRERKRAAVQRGA